MSVFPQHFIPSHSSQFYFFGPHLVLLQDDTKPQDTSCNGRLTWPNRKEGNSITTSPKKRRKIKWLKLWPYIYNNFQVKTTQNIPVHWKKNLRFYCNFYLKSSAYLSHMKLISTFHITSFVTLQDPELPISSICIIFLRWAVPFNSLGTYTHEQDDKDDWGWNSSCESEYPTNCSGFRISPHTTDKKTRSNKQSWVQQTQKSLRSGKTKIWGYLPKFMNEASGTTWTLVIYLWNLHFVLHAPMASF